MMLGIITFGFIVKRKTILHIDKNLFLVFNMFVIFSLVSALVNEDLQLLLAVMLMFMIYVVLTIIIPTLFQDEIMPMVSRSLFILHVPIIFIPMIFDKMTPIPYKGIFYTTSAFGTVVATMFALSISKLLYVCDEIIYGSERISRLKATIVLLLSAALFYLVIISGSRISVLTSLMLIIMSGAHLTRRLFTFRKKIKMSSIMKMMMIGIFTYPLYRVINIVIPINDMFSKVIIAKFYRKQADLLDKRGDMWSQAFREMNLFGHGRDYFSDTVVAAHNTYISLLGQFGLIPLLFFILFLVIGLYKAFKFTKRQEDTYRYTPFFIILTFMSLSMAEGMLLKSSMLMSFIYIGYVSIKTKKNYEPKPAFSPSFSPSIVKKLVVDQ